MAPRASSQQPSSPGDAARPVAEPATEAEQIAYLRRQLREKDKLIAVYQERLASPVFLLKAALGVIHLDPHLSKCASAARHRARARRDRRDPQSGLFEEAWYLAQNPRSRRAARIDRALHQAGRRARSRSRRSFSTRSYLLNYPDVAASGANPLVHYIEHGRRRGEAAKATTISPGSSASTR